MVVAVDVGYDGIFLEHPDVVAPVVEVLVDWVVVERHDLLAGRDALVESGLEPVKVFLLDVAVAHLHEGAAVDADDDERVDFGDEAVVAPEVDEGLRGALAPVVLVVAGQNVERMSDAVEDGLDVFELLVRALVGEVAVDDDKVVAAVVDFTDSDAQHRVAGVARSDVDVAEDGEALARHCHGPAQEQGRKKQFVEFHYFTMTNFDLPSALTI